MSGAATILAARHLIVVAACEACGLQHTAVAAAAKTPTWNDRVSAASQTRRARKRSPLTSVVDTSVQFPIPATSAQGTTFPL